MQSIKYRFADGTTSEIEVTDEFYTLYAELMQQEKRNHWKETRRHTSLNYLMENGIDFESPAADPLSVLPPILFPFCYGARTKSEYIAQSISYRTSKRTWRKKYFSRV